MKDDKKKKIKRYLISYLLFSVCEKMVRRRKIREYLISHLLFRVTGNQILLLFYFFLLIFFEGLAINFFLLWIFVFFSIHSSKNGFNYPLWLFIFARIMEETHFWIKY